MAQVNVDPTQDTEFHDALRAHGVIPPKPPSPEPEPEPPSAAEQREEQRKRATVTDLDAELEEASDEEEHILQRLRADRMRELAASQRTARFGRVYPISRPDYTREVTEASREQNPDPTTKLEGTGVVCYLYSPSMETCKLMTTFLDALAVKYPHSKFVSIVGSQCIPDYPDKNLPTLLIYRNGELRRQIIGLRREIGLDGMNTKQEDVELLLTAVGAIEPQKPELQTGRSTKPDEAEEETENDPQGKSIRSKTQEEEDAELDWDL